MLIQRPTLYICSFCKLEYCTVALEVLCSFSQQELHGVEYIQSYCTVNRIAPYQISIPGGLPCEFCSVHDKRATLNSKIIIFDCHPRRYKIHTILISLRCNSFVCTWNTLMKSKPSLKIKTTYMYIWTWVLIWYSFQYSRGSRDKACRACLFLVWSGLIVNFILVHLYYNINISYL